MEGEHPLFAAWEKIHVLELPGDIHLNTVARMLARDEDFCEAALGLDLYNNCLVSVVGENRRIYSEDIVIDFTQRLVLLRNSLQRRVG